jgi:hypothetical protein
MGTAKRIRNATFGGRASRVGRGGSGDSGPEPVFFPLLSREREGLFGIHGLTRLMVDLTTANPVQADIAECPECGAQAGVTATRDGDAFCYRCGTPVEHAAGRSVDTALACALAALLMLFPRTCCRCSARDCWAVRAKGPCSMARLPIGETAVR